MRVVCLGEALIDLIPNDQTSIQQAETLSILPGGAPLNVAVALKRLGANPIFVGTLSKDDFGSRLRKTLESEEIEYFPGDQVRQPTRLAVISPADLQNSFRFYGQETADTQLTAEQAISSIDSSSAGLYLSSLMFLHPLAARAQRAAIVRAVEQGVPIYSDPNPRLSLWPDSTVMGVVVRRLLSASRLAKLSLEDAAALGWSTDPEILIRKSESDWNTTLVVTDGENGSWAQTGNSVVHFPAVQVDAKDPTGAGDAFFAALISEHINSKQLTPAGIEFASVAGALATTEHGAVSALPSRIAIEAVLQSKD